MITTEIENNRGVIVEEEEETKEPPRKRNIKQLILVNWQIGIKIIELLICVICTATVYNITTSIEMAMHHVGVMYTAFTVYILINSIFLISNYLNDHIPYKTSVLFSICGSALFLSTGILLIVDRTQSIHSSPHNSSKEPLLHLVLTALICMVCIGFVYEPADSIKLHRNHQHHIGLMYTAYTGFMLINTIILFSRLFNERIPYRTVILFAISGAILFFINAIILIVDRANQVRYSWFHPVGYRLFMFTTSIVCSFLNVIVFIIDSACTYWRKEDF